MGEEQRSRASQEKCSGKEVYFPTKHGNLSPCKGYKKTRRFRNRFCAIQQSYTVQKQRKRRGVNPNRVDFIKKWGDFSHIKRYLKIQVPQNQQTNHPRFSKLRNGIALMPEPHRRGVAIANGFSKGKCDGIPPQARFFLYKNAPPTTLEGHRKPF